MYGRKHQKKVKMSCNGITVIVYFMTWITNKRRQFL